MLKRQGLYVSYNENKNGSFDQAVEISNNFGHVTWFDNARIVRQLNFPTTIFIRLKGKEVYFQGVLLDVASADGLTNDFVAGEYSHRPSQWRERSESNTKVKSVLFIGSLKKVEKPVEIGSLRPPQGRVYVDL